MALQWDEQRHGTGFPEIDAQHQQLIAQLNALNEVIDGGPGSKSRACTMIHFLEDYIEQHFGSEEQLMERTMCANCPRNKEEHKRFIEEFKELRMQLERNGVTEDFVRAMHGRVTSWVDNHIAVVDTGLKTVAN
ncbi:MAG: hemerythrin family protein [Candidatus Hydrogenedentes bacterium]|nr:hemerythrin family protein [Candidatus Hydrogenedentota bacterium]